MPKKKLNAERIKRLSRNGLSHVLPKVRTAETPYSWTNNLYGSR